MAHFYFQSPSLTDRPLYVPDVRIFLALRPKSTWSVFWSEDKSWSPLFKSHNFRSWPGHTRSLTSVIFLNTAFSFSIVVNQMQGNDIWHLASVIRLRASEINITGSVTLPLVSHFPFRPHLLFPRSIFVRVSSPLQIFFIYVCCLSLVSSLHFTKKQWGVL